MSEPSGSYTSTALTAELSRQRAIIWQLVEGAKGAVSWYEAVEGAPPAPHWASDLKRGIAVAEGI